MKKHIVALVALCLFVPSVLGFAVGSPYFTGNPLKMSPGESQEFSLVLQNLIEGDGDITAVASITSGSELATIADKSTEYFVPGGSANTKINLYVRIPENEEPGSTRTITISVGQKPDTKTGGAPIRFRTNYNVNIPIEVISLNPEAVPVKKENPTSTTVAPVTIIMTAGVLLILMLFVLSLLYHKDEHRKR